MSTSRDQLLSKAKDIVDAGGVKKHVFLPSRTEIWTVVGVEGEYLVSGDPPLCACPAFYFALTHGRKKECHHLVALKLAIQDQRFSTIIGHDDEVPVFLRLLWGSQRKPTQSN